MKMSPTFLKCNIKIFQEIYPTGIFYPWTDSFINNRKNYQNIGNKIKMTSCWKYLDHSLNKCDGLTQWVFVTLGQTLTFKKIEELEDLPWSQSMYWLWQMKLQKPAPSSQPPTSLWRKQIHMSGLNTSNWKFSITPNDMFQYQWMLIQLIW